MLKKTHKHKKQIGAPLEVIELYRNNDFVSDSLESVCASSVKITANGQITTKSVGKVGDRHIQANLQLPGLQERCAISQNKDLYKLSALLAENEAHHQAEDQNKDLQVNHEIQNAKLPWERFAHVHSKDCKLAKQGQFGQANVAPAINLKRSLGKEGQQHEMRKEIPDTNARRKQKKVKRIKKQIKVRNEDSTDESKYESTATSREPIEYQRFKAKEKKKYCKYAEIKAIQLERNIVPKLKDDFPQLDIRRNVNRLRNYIKSAVQIFDDWHTYTILLFLCAFVYLAYMLCYDISEYVSEERRYLAKMRSAGLVAKCFYYIMRLLKVPIF